MRNVIAITLAGAALLGCAAPAEQRAALDRDVDALVMSYGPVCERQGYASRSAGWRNCVYQTGKQEFSNSQGAVWNFPLVHRLGQKLGLIQGGEQA